MVNQKEKVSVIMPTYNRAGKISTAIISIQNQTYKNWELIIVDDNSKDNTKEIVSYFSKICSGIKYMKLDKNIGASGARNVGLGIASGSYITFLDSDDEYYSKKIEKQVNFFRSSSNKRLGIVSCGAIDFKDGKEYNRRMPIKQDNYYLSLLSKKKRIGAGTPFLMIKSFLVKEKEIFFDENLIAMEDWDFVLRIIKEADFDFVNDYLVKVNHHSDERLYTSKNASIALDLQYDKYKDWLSKLPIAHKKFGKNAAAIKAHHHSIENSVKFVNKTLTDYERKKDKIEMLFFKNFIYSFHIKYVKLIYLKYF